MEYCVPDFSGFLKPFDTACVDALGLRRALCHRRRIRYGRPRDAPRGAPGQPIRGELPNLTGDLRERMAGKGEIVLNPVLMRYGDKEGVAVLIHAGLLSTLYHTGTLPEDLSYPAKDAEQVKDPLYAPSPQYERVISLDKLPVSSTATARAQAGRSKRWSGRR